MTLYREFPTSHRRLGPVSYAYLGGSMSDSNFNAVSMRPTCDRCGKGFTIWKDVRRHQANCQTVTVVPCDICDKTFTRFDNMLNHMRKIHGVDKKHTSKI